MFSVFSIICIESIPSSTLVEFVKKKIVTGNMKVTNGQAALVTGGASGIGRALAVALASKGVQVTIVDFNATTGQESVQLVEAEHARISYKPPNSQPSALFVQCDVTKTEELKAAFARHHEVFGHLEISINSAGTVQVEPFYDDPSWSKTLNVNLFGLIDSNIQAIQAMKEHGGLILNIASAYGFVPNSFAPIYAASKGGVVHFTRSLAHLGMNIRVNALCPDYVDTPLLHKAPQSLQDELRSDVGYAAMDKVVAGAFALLDDESKVGECMWVPANNKALEIWPTEDFKKHYQIFEKDGSSIFTGL